MTEETQELVTKAVNAPQIIGNSAIEGMEDIDAGDIRIPRVKLLQGSSAEIKNPDQYPDLRVGMLVNSLSHMELEKQGSLYPFVPVKMFKSWMRFNAYNENSPGYSSAYEPGALIFKTYDKNDPVKKSPDAWKYKQINFLGFQPGNPMQPLFITFGSTSRPVGQSMIDMIALAGRSVFEHLFLIGSKTEESNGNTYMVYTAKSEGRPDEDIVSVGRKMYEEFNPLLADMQKSKVTLDDAEIAAPKDEGWN